MKRMLMNWLDRVRRFWGLAPTPDHPLTDDERVPRPETHLDEAAGDWQGFFGDTLGDRR